MRYLPLITPEDLAKAVVVVESETRWAGTKGEELEISVGLGL